MQRFIKLSAKAPKTKPLSSSSSTPSFSTTAASSVKSSNRLLTPFSLAASALAVFTGLAFSSLSKDTAHAEPSPVPAQTAKKSKKKKKVEQRPTFSDPGAFSKLDREAQENLRVDTFAGVKLGMQKTIFFGPEEPDPTKMFQGVGTMSIGDPQKEGGVSTDVIFFSKLGKGMMQGMTNLEHQNVMGFFKVPLSKVRDSASLSGQFQCAREFMFNLDVDVPAREKHFSLGLQQNLSLIQLAYAQALTESLSAGVQLSHAFAFKTFFDASLRYKPASSLQSSDKEVYTLSYSDLNQGTIAASYFRAPAENVQLATELTLNKNTHASGFRAGVAVAARTYQYRCSVDQDFKFSTLLEQHFTPTLTLGVSSEYHAPTRELQLGLSLTVMP